MRSTTSLTLALWGAVLGCCVPGAQVTQAAAGLATKHTFSDAQQIRDTSRIAERDRSLVALAYWSRILHPSARSADSWQVPLSTIHCDYHVILHPATRFTRPDEHVLDPAERFTMTKNRWSLGFH